MKIYVKIALLLFVILFSDSLSATELSLWLMPNGTYPEKTMKKYLTIFENKNPGVKVNLRILDWGEAWSLLEKMASEKSGPDVVQLGTTWVPYFASQGVLYDLKNEIDQYGGKESFQSNAWASTHRFNTDEIIALPWFLDTRPLLANKKYYEEQKLNKGMFDNWESFKSTLHNFKNANVMSNGQMVWPLTHSGIGDWNVVHNFAPWIWSGGGSFIAQKDGQFFSNIRNPETVKGIRQYISFALEDLVEKSDLQKNMVAVEAKLGESKALCAVWTSFIFLRQNYPPNPTQIDKDGVIPMIMPAGPGGRYSFLGGSNLSVTSFSPQLENAKKLLKFLTTDSIQALYCSDIGALSGRTSLIQERYIQNKEHYRTLLENVKYGRSYPNIPEWGKVEPALNKGLEKVWMLVQGVYGDFTEGDFLAEIDSLDVSVNAALGISQTKAAELYESVFSPDTQNTTTETNTKKSNSTSKRIFSSVIAVIALLIFIAVKGSSKNKVKPKS